VDRLNHSLCRENPRIHAPWVSFSTVALKMGSRKVAASQRHQKMRRRNFWGLLRKAHLYAQLQGVELAMYIEYPDKGKAFTYESEGFSRRELMVELVSTFLKLFYVNSDWDRKRVKKRITTHHRRWRNCSRGRLQE
jgi:hypothetical protein